MAGSMRFAEFVLDLERYELCRSGHSIKLERIPMELLILLLQSEGKLVRREVINRKLWGENALQNTEHSVNTAVNKLRFILRDDPRDPRFIQTIVGQGYRFIAEVAVEPVARAPVEFTPRLEDQTGTLNGHRGDPGNQLPSVTTPVLKAAALPPAQETGPKDPQIGRQRMSPLVISLVSVAVLMVAVALWYLLRHSPASQGSAPGAGEFHSVAVLPFVNLAQNSDQDYIVDGMTDQLITNLASSTPLRVISRSSMMHYKGTQVGMDQLARDLHVDAVLEGSFLHDGKQVRITANLIDVRNDRHLWAQVYEESGDDLLSMQGPVTSDIVRQVGLALGSSVSVSRLRPVNVKARDLYLRGRFLWNKRTLDDIVKSIAYFQEAIKADPGYAEAFAALGDAYVVLGNYGPTDPTSSLEKAQDAAEEALRLGAGLAEAHTVLGAVKTERDWDWAGAEVEYRRALELNPSYPTARHWYSLHLARLGRMQESEEEIQRARALDPLSAVISTDAAETAYWARNPKEAMTRINKVLEVNPDFAEAHLVRGKIFEQLGDYEQALAEFRRAQVIFRGGSNIKAMQGHALALGGASQQALEIARQLEESSTHAYVSSLDVAAIYCALNQPDAAMQWLNRGYQNHDKGMGMLGIDPVYDGCRSDRKFQDLISKLKLKPSA